jgi:uncharacterized membrane protein
MHSPWERHPHVRTGDELSFGEKAADVMRNAFGSWAFVGSFLGFMAIWMVVNGVLLGNGAFDKYPFILLNLALSMMAGLQGALILIAAKRADRVSAEQALAHYSETGKIDALLTQNTELTQTIANQTAQLESLASSVARMHAVVCAPSALKYQPGIMLCGCAEGTHSPDTPDQ